MSYGQNQQASEPPVGQTPVDLRATLGQILGSRGLKEAEGVWALASLQPVSWLFPNQICVWDSVVFGLETQIPRRLRQ